MNSNRIRLYAIYTLPALSLLALLYTGMAPMRLQSPFIQFLPKLLFLLYLAINAKGVYQWLNPGVKVFKALKEETVIGTVNVKPSWHRAALALRGGLALIIFAAALSWAFMSTFPSYGWILIMTAFALFLGIGFIHYLNNSPQCILVTDRGLHCYVWSYRFFAWEQLGSMTEKAEWISIRKKDKADHEINFEELAEPPMNLARLLKAEALVHNIPYTDLSQEFNPAV
ncbi:MAG: hypothetical protein AB8F95_15805 [Bacteroidia bacterium]